MKQLLIRTKIMPYESLSSLVHRLSQENFYDHTGQIYGFIELPCRFRRYQNLLSDRSTIQKLASINNCSENEIFNTTVHRFAGYFTENGDVPDYDAVKDFVLYKRTQYCPICLKESGYHKVYWNLLPVSICIKHGVILQNVCPKCHSPVTVNRLLKNRCYCGSNLLSADPVYVTSYPEVIRNQFFIQNLLGINESGDLKIILENHNCPAMELSPPEFFKLLKIFSMLILNKLPESSRFLKFGSMTLGPLDQISMKNRISNFSNFILMHSTASILLDWPQKFHEFLGEYCEIDRSKRWETGVERHFGGLKAALFDKLDDEKFDFIYNAYCNYLNEYWTGGYLGNTKVLDTIETQKIKRRHITLEEAAEILGCDHRYIVSKLINQKEINAVVHKKGPKKRYIIESESVYSLKRKMDRMLTDSDVADRLGIGVRNLKSLVKSRLLAPIKHKPWNHVKSSLFEPEDVEKFEKVFLSDERDAVVDKKTEGYLSTLDAVEAISCTNTDTPGLLQLVRQGIFNPILCREEKGLSRLLFSKDELKKYRDAYFDKKSSKFAVYRVCNILGVDERTVQRLINAGLIKADAQSDGGRQKTYVLKRDLDDFNREYLFLEDAAALLGLDVETILQGIKQGRWKDYSGIPVTRRAKYRIFRREELVR